MTDQVVSGWFTHGSVRSLGTFVYASCFRTKRLELWDFLCKQDPGSCPWFMDEILILSVAVRTKSVVLCGLLVQKLSLMMYSILWFD